MTKPYDEMLRFAKHKGLPKNFRDDLFKHDKQALKEYGNDKPFIWVIRENGTHFYRLDDKPDLENIRVFITTISTIMRQEMYFTLWTGNKWYSLADDNPKVFYDKQVVPFLQGILF